MLDTENNYEEGELHKLLGRRDDRSRAGRIWPCRGEVEGAGFGLMGLQEGCLVSDPHIPLGMLLDCHL